VFWKDLCVFADLTKIIFDRIIFRSNIQALEKQMFPKWKSLVYLFFGREWLKCFKTNFGKSFALYSPNQLFC
jgi:hypothetical protein